MAESVYILCALTSLACALLLIRGYRRSRARFLLWSALCFGGLGAHNALVFLDIYVFTQVDLTPLRHLIALAALAMLLWGLIWDQG
jgi:hypothetical protein